MTNQIFKQSEANFAWKMTFQERYSHTKKDGRFIVAANRRMPEGMDKDTYNNLVSLLDELVDSTTRFRVSRNGAVKAKLRRKVANLAINEIFDICLGDEVDAETSFRITQWCNLAWCVVRRKSDTFEKVRGL